MNLTISVCTRGRSYENTFTLAWLSRVVRLTAEVFVYCHKEEVNVLCDMYPQFKVISHDYLYGDIISIRAFVQKHQHSLGTRTFMLDDDITRLMYMKPNMPGIWWDVSINDLLKELQEAFADGADLIHGFHMAHIPFYRSFMFNQNDNPIVKAGHWDLPAAAVVALSPSLYDRGVRYENSKTGSEDLFMSFMPRVKGCDVRKMNCVMTTPHAMGHFAKHDYQKMFLECYVNYGAVMEFRHSLPLVNLKAVELYKKSGPVFFKSFDDLLERILLHNSDGAQYLREVGWRRQASYAEESEECDFGGVLKHIFDTMLEDKHTQGQLDILELAKPIMPTEDELREKGGDFTASLLAEVDAICGRPTLRHIKIMQALGQADRFTDGDHAFALVVSKLGEAESLHMQEHDPGQFSQLIKAELEGLTGGQTSQGKVV